MTRGRDDLLAVKTLLDDGHSVAEVARQSGVPRRTVLDWVHQGLDTVIEQRAMVRQPGQPCDPCPHVLALPEEPYAYLLGLYLGDGCISKTHRGVFFLRITLDRRYPGIIRECKESIEAVLPNRAGEVSRIGCVDVTAYSKHWPCLFPQHGPGRKHLRPILLEPWQTWVAVERHPRLLLRGLIHSDGCRTVNRIRGRYEYPRYMFSNRSADIRKIFTVACERAGIECQQSYKWMVSVSKKAEVEKMDAFIGPKR